MQPQEKLRTGYTTGACAAAAAKAAILALRKGQVLPEVTITLPCGEQATFAVAEGAILDESTAQSCVVKDAGDDPDVTHGAHITATVKLTRCSGITIDGGEGVARVTREGLGLVIGSAAINPVPRHNITAMVVEALEGSDWGGAQVIISVAEGEAMARGTINARLGLVGGISILGTTGIVRPYSTAAYLKTIETAIVVAGASFCERLIFTTGSRSEAFAMAMMPDQPPQAFIQVADFMGDSLEIAQRCGVSHVDVCVMIGKLTKLAQGYLATHVKDADIDVAFLARIARQSGINEAKADRIATAITGRALYDLLDRNEMERIGHTLCQMARHNLRQHADHKIDVRLVLFDFEGGVVARAAGDDKPFAATTTEAPKKHE